MSEANMAPDLKLYHALTLAEENLRSGCSLADSLHMAAGVYRTTEGDIALLLLAKYLARDRAREQLRVPADAGLDATACPECSSDSKVTNCGSGVRCRQCLACGVRWHTAEVPTERAVKR